MEDKVITEEEYEVLLKKYIKEHQPSSSLGFFGAWAWHEAKRAEFNLKLADEGYIVKKKEDK